MRTKPLIHIFNGRWDWHPAIGTGTGEGSPNYAACLWCMNRNRKEGR